MFLFFSKNLHLSEPNKGSIDVIQFIFFRKILELIKGELFIIHDNLNAFSYIFSSDNSSFLKFEILFVSLNLFNVKFKLFILIIIFSPI